MIEPISSHLPDPAQYVHRLRTSMSHLSPAGPRQQNVISHVPKNINTWTHVFPPYSGPYKVIKREPKYFVLDIGGKRNTVSIDRLKKAFIEEGLHSVPSVSRTDSPTPANTTDSAQPRHTKSGRIVRWSVQVFRAAISIKLPFFWSFDPALWFAHVEAQFAANRITSNAAKLTHLIGDLSPEIMMEVRDLIMAPPESATVDELAEIADQIAEAANPFSTMAPISSTNPFAASSDSSELLELRVLLAQQAAQIQTLSVQLHGLTCRSRSPHKGNQPRCFHRRCSRSPSVNWRFPRFCYFHRKYGKNTLSCRPPCSFHSHTPAGPENDQARF
uniref:DUF7041 domain-containing protein n=1 Tax=Octopus bimaculoides TaxID=37653 RepID=A0A0L8FP06_OCTBM